MRSVLIFTILLVLCCTVQSWDFLSFFTGSKKPNNLLIDVNAVPDDVQSVGKRYKRSEHSISNIQNKKEMKTKHLRLHQTSLLFLMDVKEMNTNEWIHLQSNIKSIVDDFVQRPDNPIYDYYFIQTQFDQIKTPITHTDPDKFLQELHELNVVTNMVCATHTLWNVIKSLSHTLPDPYIFVITDAVRNGYGNETTIRDILKHKNATISFVVTGTCDVPKSDENQIFERIAIATNGNVFDFIPNELHESTTQPIDTMYGDDAKISPSKIHESTTEFIDMDNDDGITVINIAASRKQFDSIDSLKDLMDKVIDENNEECEDSSHEMDAFNEMILHHFKTDDEEEKPTIPSNKQRTDNSKTVKQKTKKGNCKRKLKKMSSLEHFMADKIDSDSSSSMVHHEK